LLRSFAVQGSWNFETLIGTGFAFVLLPVLRHVFREEPAALRAAVIRHTEVFNSHPYLATLAAGAVARLEADGASADVILRFKNALRGSLGSIGDQLIWLSWRPGCALAAIALLLLGAPWWVAVGVYLVIYNVVHLWLRIWGLNAGLREGLGVARVLRDAPHAALARQGANVGAFLAGLCAALTIWRAGPLTLGLGFAALAAVGGVWWGLRIRYPQYLFLLLVWVSGLLLGSFSR
jgi:mannose PTS system EIID component